MSNYDFSTLNANDFERLVCDLLNKSHGNGWQQVYMPFKEGKDQGIDLLHSDHENKYKIVVQIKHYLRTPFRKLLNDLKTKEKSKIQKLNPQKYIVVTSQELLPSHKLNIMEALSPYVNSLSDVLGKEDLNALISLHKSVEEKHYKLWFSGTIALKKIINYKHTGRKDEFTEEEIKKKLRLFVNTSELDFAQTLLDSNRFVVITGDPGVGKTTLSEILIYKYLAKGYDLTVIYDNIREVEDTLINDDSKQIFYYDDFLGHTQAEINRCKSAEVSLLKIVSRIEKLKNKYLILNTRRFILNTFLEESERMRDFNLLRSESKIELLGYSYGVKRRMLDNHINESELSVEQIEIIRSLAFLICDHRNFTPRHIEFYTSKKHVGNYDPINLKNFINDNLENPKKIWEHAFNEQISDRERFFLSTMYSLGTSTEKLSMEKAFMSRIDYEVKNSNYFRTQHPFNEAVKRLNEGFIINSIFDNGKFHFINPSLEDFLRYHIDNNPYEIERILLSSTDISQWYFFYPPYSKSNKRPSDKLLNHFCNLFVSTITSPQEIYKAVIFIAYFDKTKNKQISSLLQTIKTWQFILFNGDLAKYSYEFLKAVKSNKVHNYIISKLDSTFVFTSILSCDTIEELIELVYLLNNHYGYNLYELFDNNTYFYCQHKLIIKKIYAHCMNLFSDEIDYQYELLTKNTETGLHHDVYEKIEDYYVFFQQYIFHNFIFDFSSLKIPDWQQIAETNYSDLLSFGDPDDFDPYENEPETYQYQYDEYEDEYNIEKDKQAKLSRFIDKHDDLPF